LKVELCIFILYKLTKQLKANKFSNKYVLNSYVIPSRLDLNY
jgi:hypothetical protein